jgi:uncharacterized phiE125 gp8 family phage protein
VWYPATITVSPASEPVTLDQVKAQSRIETTDEDTYLVGLIAAARAHVESMCGLRIITQTITAKCDAFADLATLPFGPVASISSLTYVDVAGTVQTLPGSVYEARADGLTASIVLKNGQAWPTLQTGSRITVTAVVGTAAAPDEIKQAMLMLIAHWYVNREAVGQNNLAPMPMAVEALLTNWRRFAFA